MAGFAHHPGDPVGDTATIPPIVNGYDEDAAKRVEHQLVELGGRLGEARLTIAWLEGALDDSDSLSLLARIKGHVEDGEADLPRLMGEAKKQVRGE